jgi:thioesterase domain-containing protein
MFAPRRAALSALVSAIVFAAPVSAVKAEPPAKPSGKPAKSAPAKSATGKPSVVKVKTDTRVYLIRGLLNVFSLGMDTLQERLSLMGFEAEVDNHNGWIAIANKIVEDRKRGNNGAVVLIGHSLGADVMFQLTERLEKENVPVRLAVFFDPTISHDISKNVEHVLNLYQLNGFGRKVTAPKGYKGELVNMDLSGDSSIGHGSIDKSERLHDLVIAKIMKVAVGPGQRKRPAKPKPVAVTPAASMVTAPASVGAAATSPSSASERASSDAGAPAAAPVAPMNAPRI